jgi:hypothetical protein
VGDKVLIKTHVQSSAEKSFAAKLAPRWEGPYLIEGRESPVNFAVGVSRGLRTVHVDAMKLWFEIE